MSVCKYNDFRKYNAEKCAYLLVTIASYLFFEYFMLMHIEVKKLKKN